MVIRNLFLYVSVVRVGVATEGVGIRIVGCDWLVVGHCAVALRTKLIANGYENISEQHEGISANGVVIRIVAVRTISLRTGSAGRTLRT